MPATELTLSPDKAFLILLRAREVDAKTPKPDPGSGSDVPDDCALDVLEDAAGLSLVNDDLEEGLSQLGYSLAEFADSR